MLFGVVFNEKTAKKNKKQDTFESLLPHVSTMEGL
jgi:hypothetical protein